MTEEEIESHITKALSDLYTNDSDLISNKAREEAISANLICYLKPHFTPPWNVDVEYNRDGRNPKKNSKSEGRFPDIIIHHRTPNREERFSPKHNFVAIEVKVHWNSEDRKKDEAKLRDMKRCYVYRYLFRIGLEPKRAILIPVWGQEIGW